ncbi:MAG: M48 family metalloprotease [Clostridia bacterium]|nr:M48 family metalloprotease [Clostridia bacterium]
MKKYLKLLLAYVTSFLICICGIVLKTGVQLDHVGLILTILVLVPPVLTALSIFLEKRYIKKVNNTKVADMQSYIVGHRNDAKRTSAALLKKLKSIRHFTYAFSFLLWLDGACISLLTGYIYTQTSFALAGVFYSVLIFTVVYSRVKKTEPIVLNEDAPVLKEKEFPKLYGIAKKAAAASGCVGEITIILSLDCNASILRNKKRFFLQIGIVLLNILSEDELFAICLHEFSHYTKENEEMEFEISYGNWLGSERNVHPIVAYASRIYSALDVRYFFNHMTYCYATSVFKETNADSEMAKHVSAEIAASALAKLNYDDKYNLECSIKDTVPDYAAESPDPNYLRNSIQKFKDAIKERHEFWDELLMKEILSNNATHPTLKMRLEALGMTEVKIVEGNSEKEYLDEVDAALDFADKILYRSQDQYDAERKEIYLDPLERVMKWEERGMPVIAEEYADVISDLNQLGRHSEAEALCDRAIEELDETASQHAYFIKGISMLRRYDKNGTDLIYHAIENNHNYLEHGLHEIGGFFCMMGMEEELLEYRKRAQELAQLDKDEYSETGFISKNDKLVRDDMPEEMLRDILDYIHSVDEDIIHKVYLVKKVISETFFSSVFVIHFYGGTDEQRHGIMHKIFRYLDTYPSERQFSLFDYFDHPDINYNKIEGSLVYSKANDKGE